MSYLNPNQAGSRPPSQRRHPALSPLRSLVGTVSLVLLAGLPLAIGWVWSGFAPAGMRWAHAARTVSVASRAQDVGGQQVGEVLVNNDVVFRIRTGAGGFSAPQRAKIVADRLADMVNSGNLSANDVRETVMNGEHVLTANDELLITADAFHAEANGTTPAALASMWQRNLRQALMGETVASAGEGAAESRGTHLAQPADTVTSSGSSGEDHPADRSGAASIEDVGPTLRTKIVPILSAGTGIRLGAAQVTGPERDTDDVKAVAELEANWKGNVRARLYVPISDLNVTRGIHRVPRVGVSALADVRLKF